MIREREMGLSLGEPNGWITTPNFEKLILGLIQKGDGWITTPRIISLELRLVKKAHKDDSFPPYFDPASLQDVREILDQFEKRKLVLHRDDREMDIWVLTLSGSNLLKDGLTKKLKIKDTVDFSKKEEKSPPEVKKKEATKSKEESNQAREKEWEEKRRAKEAKKANRALEKKKQKKQRDEERRIARQIGQAKRAEQTRLREEARLKRRKEKNRIKPAKIKKEKKDDEAKRQKRKHAKAKIPINKPKTVEKSSKKNLQTETILGQKLTSEFEEAVKKLKRRKYSILMPLFREGEDGQGMQVYFSPKGYLCYRPSISEFVMDLDAAIDIYGYEKISKSVQEALSSRGF